MKQATKIILGILTVIAVFVWINIVKSPSADEFFSVHLYFINVGQGDAELIQQGEYQILIDGGPDDSVLSELGKVMPAGDRKIEILILTHPHADHLVGLNQIIDRYEIGSIYYSGVSYDSNGYKEFLAKIEEKNIPISVPEILEQNIPFANSTLTFLWPGDNYLGKDLDNLNNSSVITKFCYLAHCALFTGDIETDEQAKMLNYNNCHSETSAEESKSFASAQDDKKGAQNNTDCAIFHSDILKLPHHGSTNGANQALLNAVNPRYAIIEVGANNKYGHPHIAVLDLLVQNNVQIFRTDQDGTIDFILNEAGITHN